MVEQILVVDVGQRLDVKPVWERKFVEFSGDTFSPQGFDIPCEHKIHVGVFAMDTFGTGPEERGCFDLRVEFEYGANHRHLSRPERWELHFVASSRRKSWSSSNA
jgi:hypothetical protein